MTDTTETLVKFTQAYKSWNAGETVSFPAFAAESLTTLGVAKPVTPSRADIARKIAEVKAPLVTPVIKK